VVESFLSLNLANFDSGNYKVMASGLLEAHYSPNARVILNGVPQQGHGFIALADIPTPVGMVRLASPKDNTEYAHELYNSLRLADVKGFRTVQVIPPIEQGIGVAINNRLIKAAFKENV
jgi:L-threonylcarbamoyladenylate synthase